MNHMDIHNQHNKWLSEHTLWREELKIWREEHRQALLASMKIEDVLRKFDDEIKDLERHILDHDGQIQAHEGVMVLEHKHVPTSRGSEMAELHAREISVHSHQTELYEKVKRKHQAFMKGVFRLNEAIDQMI